MSVRFPHHGSGGSTPATSARTDSHKFGGERPLRDLLEDIPDTACCCPAQPQVKVVMPATASHPSVDIWLCRHHWRASRRALAAAGAAVYDVSGSGLAPEGRRESAPV